MTAIEQPTRVLYEPPPARRPGIGWTRGAAVLGGVLLLGVLASVVLRIGGSQGPGPPSQAVPDGEDRGLAAQQPAAGSSARSEAGATDAAVRFLILYGSPAMYDAEQRRRVIAQITAPSVRAQVHEQVSSAFDLAARNLGLDDRGDSEKGQLVARTIPVGARVVTYTPDRAVVSVWTTGLLGVAGLGSSNPVQEVWSTETVTLDWTTGGWRWVSFEHEDGPAPIGSAQVPADADAIARAARDFAEVPGAR